MNVPLSARMITTQLGQPEMEKFPTIRGYDVKNPYTYI